MLPQRRKKIEHAERGGDNRNREQQDGESVAVFLTHVRALPLRSSETAISHGRTGLVREFVSSFLAE